MAGITINPVQTTTALGFFSSQTEGLTQGVFLDDPALRYELAQAPLASTVTGSVWGGMAISENIAPSTQNVALGGSLVLATQGPSSPAAAGDITGFSVFNQAHNMLTSPQSTAPLITAGMTCNFIRLGSGLRLAVECDPSLVSLDGSIITSRVAWDYTNQLLVPYLGTLTISSGTYVSASGVVTLTMSASITFSPGDSITISSLTGTGAYAALNGTFTALAGTAGTTVVYNAGAGHGSATITGGSLTVGGAASSALPVKVLEIDIGNSVTVSYNPTTGFATWTPGGNCALILI